MTGLAFKKIRGRFSSTERGDQEINGEVNTCYVQKGEHLTLLVLCVTVNRAAPNTTSLFGSTTVITDVSAGAGTVTETVLEFEAQLDPLFSCCPVSLYAYTDSG
jgi:hypothetical protein